MSIKQEHKWKKIAGSHRSSDPFSRLKLSWHFNQTRIRDEYQNLAPAHLTPTVPNSKTDFGASFWYPSIPNSCHSQGKCQNTSCEEVPHFLYLNVLLVSYFWMIHDTEKAFIQLPTFKGRFRHRQVFDDTQP